MKWLEQFLESSKMSSMRINFSLIIYATIVLFIALATYIVIFSVRGIEITQWTGMGIFIGGITTSIWAMASEKRKQKKDEIK